jgi:hypothetical protein
VYPRCAHIDAHGACHIGANYIVPTGPIDAMHDWQWRCLCAVHYVEWVSAEGYRYPDTPAFRLSPLASPHRVLGSVPRKEYE